MPGAAYAEAPRARFRGRTHRLIASRYPTIGVFDDIAADETELRAAFVLESMTSGRLQGLRRLDNLPAGGVVSGPSASLVMAAFLYSDPRGGRFSDSRLGAWYAAADRDTAIEETIHHNERRLRASECGFPARIQIRELTAEIDRELLDLRGADRPDLYDPDDYAASQAFAAGVRWPFAEPGEDGIVYDSVRLAGGTNVCLFRPTAVPLPIVQGGHYEYVWDAKGAVTVLALTDVARPARARRP